MGLYLGDRDAWGVVTADGTRHATDATQQAVFDKRDRLARAAILRGLRGCTNDDASEVCRMPSAKDMWDTLVSDHTQRDFSYAMLPKRQLYQCSLERGQSMADYISTMTPLRQRLRNMGVEHAISDKAMDSVLMMGVAVMHKELIEQFDLPTRQGHPPALQQATNALRSRDERNRMVGQTGAESAVVMSMNATGRGGPGGSDGQWRNGADSNGGGARKKIIKCHHCKKGGHMRRDCWYYKNKSKKVSGNGQDSRKKGSSQKRNVQGEKETSSGKSKQQTSDVIEHMQWLNNGHEDSSSDEEMEVIGMVQQSTHSTNPNNIADTFTKVLGPQRFAMLRELLGVEDVIEAAPKAGLPTRHKSVDDQKS
ncbi:uncharacterized protein IUM83_01337 [Phytophthora cinnamomi]|uniref:uncharacterized protein n=1 Tax=Phytophthora cinnamomi TaxID=4785 RepID=UPI00355A0C00|nr:hypothetical protein IUM83_01337 [Phytophthora cinnamomi]